MSIVSIVSIVRYLDSYEGWEGGPIISCVSHLGVRLRHVLLQRTVRHGPHGPAPGAQGQGRVAEEEMAALEGRAFTRLDSTKLTKAEFDDVLTALTDFELIITNENASVKLSPQGLARVNQELEASLAAIDQ